METAAARSFHVFVSHSGDESASALDLAERLRQAGLRVWLDAWQLRPGLSWQQGVLEGIGGSASCAVLIGDAGLSGWHRRELEAALLRQGPEYPVIPVLLPGAPDRTSLDAFATTLTWVDFRRGLDDAEALERLMWGITGVRRSQVTAGRAAGRAWFHIAIPRDGDLLGETISGTGPANEPVKLYSRAPGAERYEIVHSSRTNALATSFVSRSRSMLAGASPLSPTLHGSATTRSRSRPTTGCSGSRRARGCGTSKRCAQRRWGGT